LQVTSEPGIVRLTEVVERESQTGAQTMSSLVTAALDGAIAGRIDGAKLLVVLGAAVSVAATDWLLLCIDRLAAH
jgi:hypothetical protein